LFVNGYHSYTESWSQKKASNFEIAKHIDEYWCDISENCIKNGFNAANICKYPTEDLIFYNMESEEEYENESENQINSKIPESFIEIFDLFNVESGEEFDGFH